MAIELVNAIVVHRDVDLYCHGHKISGNYIIFNIWKTVTAIEKIRSTIFVDVDIGHQMVPMRMLYIMILIYIFRS